MFQFKNTGLGIKEPDTSSALPNTYGKVRTFKEDMEKSERGETAEAFSEATAGFQQAPAAETLEKNIPLRQVPQAAPTAPAPQSANSIPVSPFQSVPTPPPIAPRGAAESPELKSSLSDSFFSQKPSPAENVLPEQAETQSLPKKSTGKLIIFIAVILIVLAGGGFSYYWFFVKGQAPAVSSKPATPSPAQTAPTTPVPEPQNKNLRRLIVDTTQSPTAIKDTVQKFASDFATTAAENDLVEIKILDKNNQPIGKKDLFSGLGATIPDSVLMKLSEDYSLFARKEGGAARLGLTFKTITSSGLSDEMKNWETNIVSNLVPLYLGQTPTGISAFNSGRYKNADIRYSNFSSPAGASLDYSVISNFLVIGTSKDTSRAILDYMAGK